MIFLITIISFTILCIVYKKKMLFVVGMSLFYLLSLMVKTETFQVQTSSTNLNLNTTQSLAIEDSVSVSLNSKNVINEEVYYVLNSLLTLLEFYMYYHRYFLQQI